MKIDYVIISSDDNPMYKDFYPIVAKRWNQLGIKTYYINITDCDEISEDEFGVVHKIKDVGFVNTGFQSQVVRLFASKYINGNILMSDIDMFPISKDYYFQNLKDLTDDNVIIYSGQPYGDIPYYPMCYVLSHSNNFSKYLGLNNLNFYEYCAMLIERYGQNWNTDENFMYEQFENYKDKLLVLHRDLSRRLDRSNWSFNLDDLKSGYYLDSHMLRPYEHYKKNIDELVYYVEQFCR
jgi:hypothetical protein